MKKVRFNHTSPILAEDRDRALSAICEAAIATDGRKWAPVSAVANLIIVNTPDGEFVYLSQDDADADETGESAFAVIVIDDEE